MTIRKFISGIPVNDYYSTYRAKNRAKIRKYNTPYMRKWRKKYGYKGRGGDKFIDRNVSNNIGY